MAALLAAMVGFTTLARIAPVPAAADTIRIYGTKVGPPWSAELSNKTGWGATATNVPLRTRGYIDDACLLWLRQFCGYFNDLNTPRFEMTAQVLAIWTLAARRGDIPGFGGGYTKVDWEVGPNNDTERALRGVEPPGELPREDPCDPGSDLAAARWRIDIMTDQIGIFEVKDAHQAADVDDQIDCYVRKARSYSNSAVELIRSTELQNVNGEGPWVWPYTIAEPGLPPVEYCAWAPPEPPPPLSSVAGHIYFAPLADPVIPDEIAEKCGGAAGRALLPGPPTTARWLELAILFGISAEIRDKIAQSVTPSYQRVGHSNVTYTLGVPQLSTQRIVSFDFGDGSPPATITVPAGAGVYTAPPIRHTFPSLAGVSRYVQHATIFGDSRVVAPSPDGPVIQDGDIDTESVTDVDPDPDWAAGGGNMVGVMKVIGNRPDSGTVIATGEQPYGDPSEASTQVISSGIARSDNESNGFFLVWTGRRIDNGWKLASGTYDVNWINVGYADHSNWCVPYGRCSETRPVHLGIVTINSNGNITGASGTFFISYAANWAKFHLPNTVANTGTRESGVWITDSDWHNGNQAPLKLV